MIVRRNSKRLRRGGMRCLTLPFTMPRRVVEIIVAFTDDAQSAFLVREVRKPLISR